jgi:hypothetical protein
MRLWTLIAALALAGTALAAAPDISKVNGGITVDANQQVGNVTSVNGSIHIGDKATASDVHTVNGGITLESGSTAVGVHTVNGGITLGDGATAASLATVNGGIHLGGSARISGSVTSVNGGITLEPSVDVSGHVSTVNGLIRLNAAHVGGGLENVSRDIDIGANSHVEGGILVRERNESWLDRLIRDWFFDQERPQKLPLIVIGPGAVVNGTLKFECAVKLYVSDRATIGPVEGATAVRFSGEPPPA